MDDRERTLGEVIDYYIKSHDFNGLPVYNMKNFDRGILCDLLRDGLVEVLTEKETSNPHIKGFEINSPVEYQKSNLLHSKYSVLYPTRKALEGVKKDQTKPYTAAMQGGESHFKKVYFNIEVLERYANNPKFLIMDSGYRGNIYPKDEYSEDNDIDDEYIKDYGMAYINGNQLERAVCVFICDLARLSSQKQMLWKSFELAEQCHCSVHSGFIKNLLLGEWVDDVWIFHALIEEMIIINKQCEYMGIPRLFNKTFGTHYSEMPDGYRNILLPTLKNYYDFILVLEKMTIHNLSYKTFQSTAEYIDSIDAFDEAGKQKGSLTMLEEWLHKNIRTEEDITAIIIKPLRNIRSIRQKPAHELTLNKYDIMLYQEQINLMNKTYNAIRSIRLLFSNHPLGKNVQIPDYLVTGGDIVNY